MEKTRKIAGTVESETTGAITNKTFGILENSAVRGCARLAQMWMKRRIAYYIVLLSLSAAIVSAQEPGALKWKFTTSWSVLSSPAISEDGIIYVGSHDSNLYALNPDGTEKWRFSANDRIQSSPAIGADGTIYVGSRDDNVYAINPDGTEKWRFATAGKVYSSPVMGADGTIYVGSTDHNLYALNPDGTEKWRFETGDELRHASSLASDGIVYVGSFDGNVYAINPDGTEKWRFNAGGYVRSVPIGPDGTIYAGSSDNNLYAINPDGTEKWRFSTAGYVRSPAAIGSDGTLYVGSSDNNLYAINPDGTEKWRFTTTGEIRSAPAIGSDGVLYVGSYNHVFFAVNPDGTEKWRFNAGGAVYSSPAIDDNGVVYVGSHDRNLYAFYSSSLGLADSPWPKFGQNNQNTGSIETLASTEIWTPTDLHEVRNYLGPDHAGKQFRQMADIDLSPGNLAGKSWYDPDKGWEPIGNELDGAASRFMGNYDGNGFRITGLTINRPDEDYVGLFGYSSGAMLENIRLGQVSIRGSSFVGALAGRTDFADSTESVYNCHVSSGNISGEHRVGGLVGHCSRVFIVNSSVNGTVDGNENVGGLAGYLTYGGIKRSYSSGEVQGNVRVGGLAGQNGSVVENCFSTARVSGLSYVGGLLGYNQNVTSSYSTGKVTGNNYVGGLIGIQAGSTISHSHWNILTTGQTVGIGEGTGEGPGQAEGRSTVQMTYPYGAGTYHDWDVEGFGWDFHGEGPGGEPIWSHDPAHEINNGYPYLTAIPPREVATYTYPAPEIQDIRAYRGELRLDRDDPDIPPERVMPGDRVSLWALATQDPPEDGEQHLVQPIFTLHFSDGTALELGAQRRNEDWSGNARPDTAIFHTNYDIPLTDPGGLTGITFSCLDREWQRGSRTDQDQFSILESTEYPETGRVAAIVQGQIIRVHQIGDEEELSVEIWADCRWRGDPGMPLDQVRIRLRKSGQPDWEHEETADFQVAGHPVAPELRYRASFTLAAPEGPYDAEITALRTVDGEEYKNVVIRPALFVVGIITDFGTISHFRVGYARTGITLIDSSVHVHNTEIHNCRTGIKVQGDSGVPRFHYNHFYRNEQAFVNARTDERDLDARYNWWSDNAQGPEIGVAGTGGTGAGDSGDPGEGEGGAAAEYARMSPRQTITAGLQFEPWAYGVARDLEARPMPVNLQETETWSQPETTVLLDTVEIESGTIRISGVSSIKVKEGRIFQVNSDGALEIGDGGNDMAFLTSFYDSTREVMPYSEPNPEHRWGHIEGDGVVRTDNVLISRSHGLSLSGNRTYILDNLRLEQTAGDGIRMKDQTTLSAYNLRIRDCEDRAILSKGDVILRGGYVASAQTGISLMGSGSLSCEDFEIRDCQVTGIRVDMEQQGGDIELTDSLISESGRSGGAAMKLVALHDRTVNILNSTFQDIPAGIKADALDGDIRLNNVTFKDFTDAGMYLAAKDDAAPSVYITGSRLESGRDYGIYADRVRLTVEGGSPSLKISGLSGTGIRNIGPINSTSSFLNMKIDNHNQAEAISVQGIRRVRLEGLIIESFASTAAIDLDNTDNAELYDLEIKHRGEGIGISNSDNPIIGSTDPRDIRVASQPGAKSAVMLRDCTDPVINTVFVRGAREDAAGTGTGIQISGGTNTRINSPDLDVTHSAIRSVESGNMVINQSTHAMLRGGGHIIDLQRPAGPIELRNLNPEAASSSGTGPGDGVRVHQAGEGFSRLEISNLNMQGAGHHGISFTGAASLGSFDLEIRDSLIEGSGDAGEGHGLHIRLSENNDMRLLIQNSEFKDSSGLGMAMDGVRGELEILNSDITGNNRGGIRVSGVGVPTGGENSWHNLELNSVKIENSGGTGLRLEKDMRLDMKNSTVHGNRGDGIRNSRNSRALIEYSQISGNTGAGIYASNNSAIEIRYVDILENTGPGVFGEDESAPSLDNVSLVGNLGPGVIGRVGSKPSISNSNLYDNCTSEVQWQTEPPSTWNFIEVFSNTLRDINDLCFVRRYGYEEGWQASGRGNLLNTWMDGQVWNFESPPGDRPQDIEKNKGINWLAVDFSPCGKRGFVVGRDGLAQLVYTMESHSDEWIPARDLPGFGDLIPHVSGINVYDEDTVLFASGLGFSYRQYTGGEWTGVNRGMSKMTAAVLNSDSSGFYAVDGHIYEFRIERSGESPGELTIRSSRVYTSGDTTNPPPIHSLAFANARVGAGVGRKGLILQTRDGGENWWQPGGPGSPDSIECPFQAAGYSGAPPDLSRIKVLPDGRGLITGKDGTILASRAIFYEPEPMPRPEPLNIDMVYIAAGTFLMGSPDTDPDAQDREKPQHPVTLTRDFLMGKYSVTQSQWLAVMGEWPGTEPSSTYGIGDNHPAYWINWYDAVEFCNMLSMLEGLTPAYSLNDKTDPAEWGSKGSGWNSMECDFDADGYRLPTEAEWEYAARAGTETRFYWGDDLDEEEIDNYAWYESNFGGTNHPVGQKLPNDFGLYDMSGNIWEWCWDWWVRDYTASSVTDPKGPDHGSNRFCRGGGWFYNAHGCRSARRGRGTPNTRFKHVGFRLTRTIPTAERPAGPGMPTGLTASDIKHNGFTLSLAPAANAVSYRIYVDGELHARTASTTTDITGLEPTTTYSVQASAINLVNGTEKESPRSAAITVTTAVAPLRP